MEYLSYIIVFAVGAFIGFRVNDIFMKATFAKMLTEAGITDKDMSKFLKYWKPKVEDNETNEDGFEEVHVKIEKHGTALYMFRKDNDQFLGQGNTREELIELLSKKMTNVRLLIAKEDGSEHIGGHFKV